MWLLGLYKSQSNLTITQPMKRFKKNTYKSKIVGNYKKKL
jgi:hypothetical protein